MRGIFVLLVGLAMLLPVQALAQSSDYEDLAQRHGLQTEIPGEEAKPERQDRQDRSFTGPNFWRTLGFLIIIGAVVLLVVIIMGSNLGSYRRRNQRLKAQSKAAPPVEVWGMVPDDSWDALLQRLRASKDHSKALHDMLLAAIGFCQKELNIHIPRANTPREIDRSLDEDFDGRGEFSILVQGAELAWFGNKPVDEPLFEKSLEALERLIRQRP